MAHPNFSDKSTKIKPPKLLDQVRDKFHVKHSPAKSTVPGHLRDHSSADSNRTKHTCTD